MSRPRVLGPAALAVLLIVAGVLVLASADASGWTAYTGGYAPLDTDGGYSSELSITFDDRWALLWSGRQVLGACLVVAGLLVTAVVAGWSLGRRSAARG